MMGWTSRLSIGRNVSGSPRCSFRYWIAAFPVASDSTTIALMFFLDNKSALSAFRLAPGLRPVFAHPRTLVTASL